jgi:hypothetical protein
LLEVQQSALEWVSNDNWMAVRMQGVSYFSTDKHAMAWPAKATNPCESVIGRMLAVWTPMQIGTNTRQIVDAGSMLARCSKIVGMATK